jgi:hypothetical protein
VAAKEKMEHATAVVLLLTKNIMKVLKVFSASAAIFWR